MIGYLRGLLLDKRPDHVLIDIKGVGYEVEVPVSTLCRMPSLNEPISLFIHTHVREDSLRLFGFFTHFDKLVFQSLLAVSGVGPKAALALLGSFDGQELCETIGNQHTSKLTAIPGIGGKTAERLVLELKTKLQKLSLRYAGSSSTISADSFLSESVTNIADDLKTALLNLGYKEKQFLSIVDKVLQGKNDSASFSFEQALKEILKKLSEHVWK